MDDDDWLQEFNKPKAKPVQPQIADLRPQAPVAPVEPTVVLREPPPSLIHTNSHTQYVLINTEIQPVLRLPEWVIERLNFLFLSKPFVVVIACDPAGRGSGQQRLTGYGVMRAMGRREVEIGWMRVWPVGREELATKQLLSHEIHRNLAGVSVFDEISNLLGRNVCRHLDKLVFNDVDTDYINEREIIFTARKTKLNKRFQQETEINLITASYQEYCAYLESADASCLLPSLRVISATSPH